MFCQHCGTELGAIARFCASCGKAASDGVASPTRQEVDGVEPPGVGPSSVNSRQACFRAAIGHKNAAYYLDRFDAFEKGGSRVGWHWPAFFITFYWLLYRKQWKNALVYFSLPYVFMFIVGMIGGIVGGKSGESILGWGYIGYLISVFLIPPMFANAWYFDHCKKVIAKVNAQGGDSQFQLGAMSGRGGTSNIALVFVGLFAFVAVIGILAAIAIPQYQDYVTRARMADAYIQGQRAARAVGDYYVAQHELPPNLSAVGIQGDKGIELSLNPQNGTITVRESRSRQEFVLIPHEDAGSVMWDCEIGNLPKSRTGGICSKPNSP